MKKQKCEIRNFDGCVEVCKKVGESFSNCAQACSVATKNLCSRKTSLSVGSPHLNTKYETEHNHGWILLLIFIIVIGFILWKFIL